MGLMSPRPRGDSNLTTALAAGSGDRQQIRRLVSRIPKAPIPPRAGGIVGVTRAEAWSFAAQNDGFASSIGVTEWGISSIYDTPGAGITSASGAFPELVVAEAGWYSFTASWELSWFTSAGTPPTKFEADVVYSSEPEPGFYEPGVAAYPAPDDPRVDVRVWISGGPILLPAGGTITLAAGWNNLTPHTNPAAHVDITLWG